MHKIKVDKLLTILGFIVFALGILVLVQELIDVKHDNVKNLKVRGNAQIIINDEDVWEGDYEYATFRNVIRGDVIDITMNMPVKQYLNPVLLFETGNNKIKVYQDEQLIYSFGELEYKQNAPVADTQLIIPLDVKKGNDIRVEVTISKSVFEFDFPEFILMESVDVGYYKLTGNAVHTYIGLFLILFGLILLVFFVANVKRDYLFGDIELLLIALYSILGGIWMWSHYGVLEMFWDNNYAILCMNIVSEFLMPVVVLFFTHIKMYHKKAKLGFWCLEILTIIFVISVLLLLTIKRFFLFFSYLILWVYFTIIISVFEWQLVQAYIKNRNKLNGFILASVISYYISIVMCFVTMYNQILTFELFHKIFCNTIVFVIVQMFLVYVIPLMEYLQERTERSVLIELAYMDGLTGLLNRNRSEEIVNQIRYDEENFYYVIEFEIVNLKTLNRCYGYAAGDQALSQFAKCLKESFERAMLVSRYSGDEFIVILENVDQQTLDYEMELFVEKIRLYNETQKEQEPIQYVYGIGECNCMIKGHDIYKMLKVADKRKYEKVKQAAFDK